MNTQKINIIVLQILFILTSCRHSPTYPQILSQIDSLTIQKPDSALYMLTLLNDFMPIQPEEIRMYHQLLTVKAQERCMKPHTSDSLMKRVVGYYKEKGPSDKLMEAYYLLACIYRDLNDVSYALEYFQKATDVDCQRPSPRLKAQAYTQIGTLFTYQGFHIEATHAYRKACSYARQTSDSLEQAEYYKNLAKNFMLREMEDSTLYYYELAGHFDATGVLHETIDLYIRQENFEKARGLLEQNRDAYLCWGDYYHGINKQDSASRYYLHALNDEPLDELQCLNIYRRLARYAEEQGRLVQALHYMKLADYLQDSLSQKYNIEFEHRMQALYTRQHQTKAENERQVIRNEQKGTSVTHFLTGGLVVGLVAFGVRYVIRRRKTGEVVEEKVRNVKCPPSEICKLVRNNAHDPEFKLDESQWEVLREEMDEYFNDFTGRLFAIYPKLNDVELRVCYLLKLGVSPSDISHIILRQKSTVSGIRERLYRKLHGEDGSPKMLDRFIEDF